MTPRWFVRSSERWHTLPPDLPDPATMTLPGLRDWVFSLKTFAGAMLAVWVALRLDLDRPYWAMATAYIVAQPLAGAMRSKAVYRFVGTLIGSIVTLVLVPNLANAPELLTAAMALWIAMCVYFAVLDRTPRSYLFLLAGYSVALIGFPSVATPGAMWDIALARVEEISIGIACSTLVGTSVFPRPLGPALSARMDSWIRNAAALSVAVLSDGRGEARLPAARRRVAGDAVEIGMLASHLGYDTSNLQSATRPVELLQQRVLLLLPVISGIDDRLTSLRANGGVTAGLARLLDRISVWIDAVGVAGPEHADGLRTEIAEIEPAIDAASDWNAILLSGVLLRLRELVDLVHDVKALRRGIAAGRSHVPRLALPEWETGRPGRHRDHAMALHSAVATIVAIGLICAYWIATGWPEGAGAAALGATGCAFFASQDDPAPSLVSFTYAVVVALLLDAWLLFAVLPMVHEFETLVLAMAPPFLLIGALMSMPATARAAGPVAFIAATELALSSSYSADFAAYVNGAVAAIVGLGGVALLIRVIRSVGAEWSIGRLLRANRAEIAAAAATRHPGHRLAFVSLMMDRLSLIVPRLADSTGEPDSMSIRAMADLRVGVNIVDLQHDAPRLGAPARHAVDAMLHDLAAHYRRAGQPPAPALLDRIDAAIAEVTRCGNVDIRDPLLQLAGIRRGLFPSGPAYVPAIRPDPAPLPHRQAA